MRDWPGDGSTDLIKTLEQHIKVREINAQADIGKEKLKLQAALLIRAKKIRKIENVFVDHAEVVILPILSREELANEVKKYNEAAKQYELEAITYEKLYYSYIYGCKELMPFLYKLKERMEENETAYQEQD